MTNSAENSTWKRSWKRKDSGRAVTGGRGAEYDDSDVDEEQNEDVKQSKDEDICHFESKDEEMSDMAQPEFEGLWDQFKPYKAPKDLEKTGIIRKGASKMENEILARRLQKLREGIVVKLVAVGREFKGCAFKSKPDVIHFKVQPSGTDVSWSDM